MKKQLPEKLNINESPEDIALKVNELISYLSQDKGVEEESLAEKQVGNCCDKCATDRFILCGTFRCDCHSTKVEEKDTASKIIDYFFGKGVRLGQADYDFIKKEISHQLGAFAGEIIEEARQTQPQVFSDKLEKIITQSLQERKK